MNHKLSRLSHRMRGMNTNNPRIAFSVTLRAVYTELSRSEGSQSDDGIKFQQLRFFLRQNYNLITVIK